MSNRAWVTLATNDSYGLGALVLAHSLRRAGSEYPSVVLITPSVTEPMRERLRAVFAEVVTVDVLDSRDAAHLALLQRPELGITFTKIHCWNLTQYEKCVFLDADTLIVRNCDELFEREELSAAPDVGWPDCFNSGVFVFKPSAETFEQLIKFAQERGSFDGGDQGLLNSFFSDWARGDINKHLPFLYNVTSAAFYSYLPALQHYGQNLKIIHFIGAAKPWLQQFNFESRTVDAPDHLREFLQLWWDLFVSQVHTQLDVSMVEVPEAPPAVDLTRPSQDVPVLPPQDVCQHYEPELDPESEFLWHRPSAQIHEEVNVPEIDMTEIHDPWDLYRGHIPPNKEESNSNHSIFKKVHDVSEYEPSHNVSVITSPAQVFIQQYVNEQKSHQIEQPQYGYSNHDSQYHQKDIDQQWNISYPQSQHQHQPDEHHEHWHQEQHQQQNLMHYTEPYYENKHDISEHGITHNSHDFHHYNSHHHIFHEHSYNAHKQSSHHDQNNSSHSQNLEHNKTNNYTNVDNFHKHNEDAELKQLPPRLEEQEVQVYHVHVDHKKEKPRRRRKVNCIDIPLNLNEMMNGDALEDGESYLDIIPRHPYDGFYLRHQVTIDSRGRKVCTHEIPPTPTPSPPLSPSPTPDSPLLVNSAPVDSIHESENEEQSGVAGNLARVAAGTGGSQREAIDELARRQGWEAGNIDYMGADAFDNILAKITQTLNQPRASPPKQLPPKEPTPPPKQPTPPKESSPPKEQSTVPVAVVQEGASIDAPVIAPTDITAASESAKTVDTTLSADTSAKMEAPVAIKAPVTTEVPVESQVPASTKVPRETEPSVATEVPAKIEAAAPTATEVPVATKAPTPVAPEVAVAIEAPVTTETPLATEEPAKIEATVPVEAPITSETAAPVQTLASTEIAPVKAPEALIATETPAPSESVIREKTIAPSDTTVQPTTIAEVTSDVPVSDRIPKPVESTAEPKPAQVPASPEASVKAVDLPFDTAAPNEAVVSAAEVPTTVEAQAPTSAEIPATVETPAGTDVPISVESSVVEQPKKTEETALPPTPPASPKSSPEQSTPVSESVPKAEAKAQTASETEKSVATSPAESKAEATPPKTGQPEPVSDSPPLANTPSKDEAPTVPAAKSEERRKPAGKLQLSAPAAADPLPTPDSELEDAAALAQSIIASELQPAVGSPLPATPVQSPLPVPPQQQERLSVAEPELPTPPVGTVSLAQIGVKPAKGKSTIAAQIESSVSEKAEPESPIQTEKSTTPVTPKSSASPVTAASPMTPAASEKLPTPETPTSPETPATPVTPTTPTTPTDTKPADAPKKKVVKKVVKKEGVSSGEAPVPPPRKKEKKPKEK